MKSRFYGGSLDGQTRANVRGIRYVVRVDSRTRETYVRDRWRDEPDALGAPAFVAFKLESTEKCTVAGSHEGSCRYEIVEP